MELKDFVKDVVFQLSDGIREIRAEQNQHEVIINPNLVVGSMSCGRYVPNNKESYNNIGRPVQYIKLDLQLEATEHATVAVGGNVGVSILQAKGDYTENGSHTSGNRMSIAIPICLPTTNVVE